MATPWVVSARADAPGHGAVRLRAALAIMTASGFAALGYQIVWTQQTALWLGHEAVAVLAVVTAFFGGLALGAFTLGARIDRSARPARWYAACEVMIGAWSLLLVPALRPVSALLLGLIGPDATPIEHGTVAFVGTLLVLLPATVAMGATLPAMERVIASLGRGPTQIAALYACNTLGAVLGVVIVALWSVPAIGLVRTAMLCAGMNTLCAVLALRLDRVAPPVAAPAQPRGAASVLARLAATGLLGIGYEVLVVRVLSQVAEDTAYTFAILLAVYLVGTTLGAAVYTRQRDRGLAAPSTEALLCLQALACLIGMATLWGAELLHAGVVASLGAGLAGALGAETALALAAFGLPTFAMGALFSHLAIEARTHGAAFGTALGFNTLGAAAAPLIFGVALAPPLGAKLALVIVVAGYLALALYGARRSLVAGVGMAALAVAVFAPPLVFIERPDGGRIISYREGVAAAVSVVEDAAGVARLRINNRQQEGSSATALADGRQALLPLLLHPAPQRALFLGLGTGVTASVAAQDPLVEVDAVELLPEVIEASHHFSAGFETTGNRLRVIQADARRFVQTTPRRYDVIVADNFHPARSGSGALYTVEHFAAIRSRLSRDGLFCQWLPLHQLDVDTLRSIVASFVAVYPHGWAMLATHSLETPVIGLVGRADDGRFERTRLETRLQRAAAPLRLAASGLPDDLAVLGSFIAGPRALARFAASAPRNTDDRPIVAYRAPRITYAPVSLPRDRLLALLNQLAVAPAELVDTAGDLAFENRLVRYWRARDQYLAAGRRVVPSADPHAMLAQVRAPLLAVLHTSPDFRPAYDPLLRMALAVSRTDPAQARALLTALKDAQPARTEAEQALRRLGSSQP